MVGGQGSAPSGEPKELRFALVCYGGSSLAIYMHGITKEVNRLVKASVLLEAGLDPDVPTERVYRELLQALAEKSKVDVRVVVDVIAGTSAGGINGVFLAKALAGNRSQDSLRDVWFTRGDMDQLVVGPSWIPWKPRLLLDVVTHPMKSPLRGDAMARWLFKALQDMGSASPEPAAVTTLLPGDHLLELYVTITDFYGYDRQVPITRPRLAHDMRHRHALRFRYRSTGIDEFGDDSGLAFAARTTSCFPGVFPPVSFRDFQSWVPEARLDTLKARDFRLYTLAEADPAATYFVDGGVLDNMPFGWAIDAIRARRADGEVDRRLLYLEPAPGEVERSARHDAPNTLTAALGALSGIPSHEPILDDLLDVVGRNERVLRIRDIIETSFDDIAKRVEEVVGQGLDSLPQEVGDQWATWSDAIHQQAQKDAAFGFSTYIRTKISSVVDRYADTVCDLRGFPPDSNHAILVRSVLRCWADDGNLFEKGPVPTPAQLAFLKTFDLGFAIRRLRFVLAAFNWWYRDLAQGKPDIPPRADLDAGKQILWDAIVLLESLENGMAYDDALRDHVALCFPDEDVGRFLAARGLDSQGYLEKNRDALDGIRDGLAKLLTERLNGFSAGLYEQLAKLTAAWHPDRRRDLAVRYLGFPYWDILLFPIESLADVGEGDWVEVVRMSPVEATVLKKDPHTKVQGRKFHHFWAFFDRTARENDYLWGRLDGAEHLIRILVGADEEQVKQWAKRVFDAILAEDAEHLGHAAASVDEVRTLIAAI